MAKGLEVFEPSKAGYQRTVEYGGWLVATMTFNPETEGKDLEYLERHMETDEVFILTEGEATLIIGLEMEEVPMIKNKLYNVKKETWHNITMSKDARIIIVENIETGLENSELYYLNK